MACLVLWQAPDRWHYYVNTSTRFTQQLKDVASWCQQHLPPHATLLVHDAGYISYATSFHLVDLVGLKTPASILAHEKWTLPSKGQLRAKAVADIIQKTHPSYLILLPDWGVAFGLISGLEEQNVRLKLLYDADNGYEVYALR